MLKRKIGLVIGIAILLSFVSISYIHQAIKINFVPKTKPLFKSEQFKNSEPVNEDLKYFEKRFKDYIQFWNIKGASVAIAKDGQILYTKGFGVADTLVRKPVEPSNLFRVASISKLITAAAVMKLVEDGQLTLDDKVFGACGVLNQDKYMHYKDRRYEDITIEHLLNHSGGWTPRYGDPMFTQSIIAKKLGKKSELTTGEIITYKMKHRLHFTPGSRSSYSNLGYAILGEVVERVSGMPYDAYVKLNIMYPIGVYDVYLGNNTSDHRHFNEVFYYEQPDAIKVTACDGSGRLVSKSDGGTNIHSLGAAGGWVCSAPDLLKFVLSIDGEDNRFDILSDSTIQKMTDRKDGRFSPLGWRTVYGNGDWIRTGTLAGSTCLIKKGQDDLTYVVLCNTSPWRGADFPFLLKGFMDKELNKVASFEKEEPALLVEK